MIGSLCVLLYSLIRDIYQTAWTPNGTSRWLCQWVRSPEIVPSRPPPHWWRHWNPPGELESGCRRQCWSTRCTVGARLADGKTDGCRNRNSFRSTWTSRCCISLGWLKKELDWWLGMDWSKIFTCLCMVRTCWKGYVKSRCYLFANSRWAVGQCNSHWQRTFCPRDVLSTASGMEHPLSSWHVKHILVWNILLKNRKCEKNWNILKILKNYKIDSQASIVYFWFWNTQMWLAFEKLPFMGLTKFQFSSLACRCMVT